MYAHRFIKQRFDIRLVAGKAAQEINHLKKSGELSGANVNRGAIADMIHGHQDTIDAIINVHKVAALLTASPHFKRILFFAALAAKAGTG